ncbi:hypothetical protein J2809_002938 [Arthrobacter pascens]|nr:hypothetical protein [Arthrobacter pascens]
MARTQMRERGVDGVTEGLIVSVWIVLQIVGRCFHRRWPQNSGTTAPSVGIFGAFRPDLGMGRTSGIGQGSLTAVARTSLFLVVESLAAVFGYSAGRSPFLGDPTRCTDQAGRLAG